MNLKVKNVLPLSSLRLLKICAFNPHVVMFYLFIILLYLFLAKSTTFLFIASYEDI